MSKVSRWLKGIQRGWSRVARKRIPVLTYHSARLGGLEYHNNDHLALAADLQIVRDMGFRITSVVDLVAYLEGHSASPLQAGKWVALTFDDATDFDYFDFVHPDVQGGCVKSFHRILVESLPDVEVDPARPLTVSFAIADPTARAAIDSAELAGRGHMRDFWWSDAASRGVMGIGVHSWDHAHVAVPVIRQRSQQKGTFMGIDNIADADAQIASAARLIWYRSGGLSVPYFAYPFGEAPDFLTQEYFPRCAGRHEFRAAFSTGGDYVTRESDRWSLPRFVCGEHWAKPGELSDILRGATG